MVRTIAVRVESHAYRMVWRERRAHHGRMKPDLQRRRPSKKKLILGKESLRKLSDPDLANIVGGAQTNHCETITLKCCLTR